MQENVVEIALNFLKGEWFTSKMSGLVISIFLINQDIRKENKEKLIKQIIEISMDQVYPVRKAVADSIPQLIELIPIFPQDSLTTMVRELLCDVADVVKNSIIEGALLFLEKMKNNKEILIYLLPAILDGYSDNSWRVRKVYIEHTKRIFSIFESLEVRRDQVIFLILKID